jgi:hypothetical protein
MSTPRSFLLVRDHWSLTNCLTNCPAIPDLEQMGDGPDLLGRYSAKSMPKLNKDCGMRLICIMRRGVFC